jgi:hypothetical protein
VTARDGEDGKLVTPTLAAPRKPTLADVLDQEHQRVDYGQAACGYQHGCHGDHTCDRLAGHEISSPYSQDLHAYRTEDGWVTFNHCEDHDACDERLAALAAEQAQAAQDAADAKAAEHTAIGQAVLAALLANPEPLARALRPHLARLDKLSDH